MATVTCRLTDDSQARLTAFWDGFIESLKKSGPLLGEVAIDFAHQQTIETFDTEGANGDLGLPRWTELAEWTLVERLQEGYEEGPILYRSGELMAALTDESHWNHVVERNSKGANFSAKVGTTDPRFERLQLGSLMDNLPARPMWPQGSAEERFVELLERKLAGNIEDAVAKRAQGSPGGTL